MDFDSGSESAESYVVREGADDIDNSSASSSGAEYDDDPKTRRDIRGSIQYEPLPAVLRLPPELLLEIFEYMDRPRDQWAYVSTCHAWFQAAIESIWFRPSITSSTSWDLFLRTVCMPVDELFMPYASFVRRLNLTSIASHLTSEQLKRASVCNRLERLTLANCSKITDEGVGSIVRSNKGLQSIDLSYACLITDKTLFECAENCRRLQGLYATYCDQLTDEGVEALIKNCPWIKRVKLNGCHLLSDNTVEKFTNSKSLVELDLSACTNVSHVHVASILMELPQLREFRLASSGAITDVPFLSIPDNNVLDRLRVIDLTMCNMITDETVRKLVKIAPRLRNVVLAKCTNITDRAVQSLVQLGRNLQYLHLGHCSNITDRGINMLVVACPRIQYIDVACCGQLTDEAVKDISTLPRLRRIGLVKCQNITDAAIYALSQRRGSDNMLERVHLSYCSNLTLKAIMVLVNACGRLTHLSLTGVPPFIRSDLTQFCRSPPPEFNQHQQAMFCVFSGKGVDNLRTYLNASQSRMFEMATTDDQRQAVIIGDALRHPGANSVHTLVLANDVSLDHRPDADMTEDYDEDDGTFVG